MLDRYGLDVGIFALWYAYLCITWNIVGGFAGEFTFAHPVYVAMGGYTSAVLLAHWHISPWLGVLAGAALAALLAAALSWINFRQRLPHLTYALITLAITFIVVVTLRSLDVLGASEGLFIRRGHDPLNFMFRDKASYYYIILTAVCLVLAFTVWLQQSRLGLHFVAVRDNPEAAAMLGVDPLTVMVASSTVSAGLAAFGGTFYAQYLFVIDPSVASAELAVEIILFTAIGGLGTVWGPFWGPVAFVVLSRYLSQEFATVTGVGQFLYGVVIVVVLLVLRDGFVSWLGRRWRRGGSAMSSHRGSVGKSGLK
ncbi:MAG: branched-chain amino acid ABC transporter permease [Candidatus Rokubacteria bacterium]|nr:branched-chain amino acid ABC transporter permease [Candidatus Rokubacteria bacterium]